MQQRLDRLSPHELHVGRGVLGELPGILLQMGKTCVVVHDRGGTSEAVVSSEAMAQIGIDVRTLPFAGECTQAAIDGIRARIVGEPLVAFGGGKVIDAVKAAAAEEHVPCLTVPTCAATCAAYTPLSILHEEDGAYAESRRLQQSVAVLLLDPDVLLTAPPRFLAAGLADATARAFDTILASRVDVPSATAATSLAICRDYLFGCLLPLGGRAIADNRDGRCTEPFVRVVEACIIGAGLAGETGARFFGRSFSHAVAYALSHVVNADRVLHGEAAGLGVLVHCLLDPESPVPFDSIRKRFHAWGLPVSLSEVGIRDVSSPAGRALAEQTHHYLDRERAIPFEVDPEAIHNGFQRLERGDS